MECVPFEAVIREGPVDQGFRNPRQNGLSIKAGLQALKRNVSFLPVSPALGTLEVKSRRLLAKLFYLGLYGTLTPPALERFADDSRRGASPERVEELCPRATEFVFNPASSRRFFGRNHYEEHRIQEILIVWAKPSTRLRGDASWQAPQKTTAFCGMHP